METIRLLGDEGRAKGRQKRYAFGYMLEVGDAGPPRYARPQPLPCQRPFYGRLNHDGHNCGNTSPHGPRSATVTAEV